MSIHYKPGQVTFIEITAEDASQRIDNFLLFICKGVPKSRIYKALRAGEVRVNKKRVKPPFRLSEGDRVRVPPLYAEEKPKAFVSDGIKYRIESAILYEDKDLMVVNKPSGLAVHGGSGVDFGLIEVVRALRPECARLSLVHRLDRETSGCILLAKKNTILRALHQQLREKKVQKQYLALVQGRWPRRRVAVDAPLDRQVLPNGERIVRVIPEGKPSLTRFRIVEAFQGATLIEASPVTGRTHQIRVHCKYAGFPLFGDKKYGSDELQVKAGDLGIERLFLHAAKISFSLPGVSGKWVFEAPLPADLESILKRLKG